MSRLPPLVAFALGAVLGAFAWPALAPPLGAGIAAGAVLVGLACLRAATAPLALFAAGLCLGLAAPARVPDPPALSGDWRLRGHVVTAAIGTRADVAVGSIARPGGEWRPLSGRVRVRFPSTPPPPGTAVAIDGAARPIALQRLPGAPDPAWEAAMARVATDVDARVALRLGRPPPVPDVAGATHAGLLRAMLDGERAGLDDATRELLQRTGTWHLVSISGLHVGLGAAAAWGLVWLLTRPLLLFWERGGLRWPCAIAAVAAAVAYATWAGSPLPAQRAAVMVAAGSLLAALDRRAHAPQLLSLAVLGSTWAEPAAVASPGLQMSFGALIGILLLEDRVTRWLPPDTPRLCAWPVKGLATTFGATVGTLPVVAWHIQSLSPLSPLANLWAVPLVGTIGTPALLASQVLPAPLGPLALRVADLAVGLGLWGLPLFDREPWHPAVGPLGALVLAAVPFLGRRPVLALGAAALALGLRERPRDLAVTFLAIGQGDAALVRWPDGRDWLIDGGPPGDALLFALRRLGVRRLDRVVVSHAHPDHVGGLGPVFEGLPVGAVVVPRLPREGEDAFAALLLGQWVELGVTAPLDVLHPLLGWAARGGDAVNEESLVVRIGHGRRRFLFPGDVEEDAEAALAAGDVRADVLKVPHHGSGGSSSPAFVAAVAPEIAVVSCGRENRYGHPHPRALRSYAATRLYRTDRDGNVTVRTDGEALRVELGEVPEPWRLGARSVP